MKRKGRLKQSVCRGVFSGLKLDLDGQCREAARLGAVGIDRQDRVYVFNRGEHPMMVFDREGNFLWFNHQAEEVTGYRVSEWRGRSFAPLIHPDQMSYERAQVTGLVLNPVPESNISYHFKLRRGDVDAAWSQCDLVVEDTFSTQFVQYAHLEPHVTIALYDAAGALAAFFMVGLTRFRWE